MKKGLLLGIAGMAAAAGTANVRAACIPTQDCAELGYKYTSSECSGDRIACPFDTSKFFCFEPQICNYSYTAASCSSQCKSVGSTSCVKDGTTYYSSCGSSFCSSGQTCSNGTCKSNSSSSMSGETFSCCDDSGSYCGYYSECKRYTLHSDCSTVIASYKSLGCSASFRSCSSGRVSGIYDYYWANFRCP